MNLDLKGKNALVCGSSRGIGKASAFALAELGANVTLVARSTETMMDLTRQMTRMQGQSHDFLKADFTNSTELKRKIRSLVAGKPIHILINNTGGPPGGPITNAKVEEFEQAFHNHLICSHLLTTIVMGKMKKEGYGRVINIISTSVKEPIPNLGVSNTIRAAMGNWAKTMAGELGPFGITVNNVLPGYTMTDRLDEIIQARAKSGNITPEAVMDKMKSSVPASRFAQPEEVGAAVAFLASPAAGYINGVNLPVDGGRTRSL